MKCPYCNAHEAECVPDVVYKHAESYGGGLRHFECKTCGKVIEAGVRVIVAIDEGCKTDKGSDW